MTTTPYINLGPTSGSQPDDAEITSIKTNLKIGTSSLLDATWSGTSLILTDPGADKTILINPPSTTAIIADHLANPRAFSISGAVKSQSANPTFDGQNPVNLVTTLQDNVVDTSNIKNLAVTPSKLSGGAPTWDSVGNLSLTSTDSVNYLNIGKNRTVTGSSGIIFTTDAGSTVTNARLFRSNNGDMYIGNAGTGNIRFCTNALALTKLIINSTGNVGIGLAGTTSPTNRLHIETPTTLSPAVYIAPSADTANSRSELLIGNWSLRQDLSQSTTKDFSIGNMTSGFTSNLYFNSTGKVAIGGTTITPGSALTVNGDVSATTFIGTLSGSATGNVYKNGTNPVYINADADQYTIGTDPGTLTSTWPIDISGNADTSTLAATATTVPDGSITASKLYSVDSVPGNPPVFGARAFGYCAALPTSGSIHGLVTGCRNISAITWDSVGTYKIQFNSSMLDNNYTVLANAVVSSGIVNCNIIEKTSTYFKVTTTNYLNAVTDAASMEFVIFR